MNLRKTTNIHVATAAKLMGHSNPLITLKLYTQAKDDEIDLAGITMTEYLKKILIIRSYSTT